MISVPPVIPVATPKAPHWQDILRQCGYPPALCIIDFETYFAKDYRMGRGKPDLSTIEYVTDPRFEILGCALFFADNPYDPFNAVFPYGDDADGVDGWMRYLQESYGEHLEKLTIVAHNFNFDGAILARRYGIYPKYSIDLLGLARHYEARNKNDLGSLAERHNLPKKGDTKEFMGLHLQDRWDVSSSGPPQLIHSGMSEEKRRALSEYAKHDVWLEWELFKIYLPRLSNPKTELRIMQHTLGMFQSPSITVDIEFADTLKIQMQEKVDAVISKTGYAREHISGNISFTAILESALIAAGDTIDKYQKENVKGKKILAIAKTDPELDMLKAHDSIAVRELLAARTAIKSWPNHIKRIERIVAQATAADGLLPVPLNYYGAHTGRWSGGERINLQNLSSRGGDLVNSIRHLLIAPEGKSLVIVDAAQVEARGLAWIAGQEDLCELFQQGREVYCEYASKMAGVPLRKANKTDPSPLNAYYTRMRNMGKVQVLGCGYGMGALKCIAFAASSYGVELTKVEAEKLVKNYRKSVPQITRFWRMVEQRFKAAARYHEHGKMDRGLEFYYDASDDLTIIKLPNGRLLRYKGVRVSIIEGRETLWMPDPMKGGSRILMWGGYLTENIVQAFCRDFLAEAVLEVERQGYRVALLVHDEIVSVVPNDRAEGALAAIVRILSVSPEWALDCPLSAEGQISKKYGK